MPEDELTIGRIDLPEDLEKAAPPRPVLEDPDLEARVAAMQETAAENEEQTRARGWDAVHEDLENRKMGDSQRAARREDDRRFEDEFLTRLEYNRLPPVLRTYIEEETKKIIDQVTSKQLADQHFEQKRTLRAAMVRINSKVANPPRDRTATVQTQSSSYTYKYSSLPKVLETYRQAMTEEGCWYSSMPRKTESGGDSDWELTVAVYHGESGEEISITVPLIIEIRQRFDQHGNRLPLKMTNQIFASACTHMTRYLFNGIMGVAADHDDDGAVAAAAGDEEPPPPGAPPPPKAGSQGLAEHLKGKTPPKSRTSAPRGRPASRPSRSTNSPKTKKDEPAAALGSPPPGAGFDAEMISMPKRLFEKTVSLADSLKKEPNIHQRLAILQTEEIAMEELKQRFPDHYRQLTELANKSTEKDHANSGETVSPPTA